MLVNPYTVELATRNSLIVFEYFWPALACLFLCSDSIRNLKLSAAIFGFSLHENPRGALFLSLAALILRKKENLGFSIKDFLLKYISYVLIFFFGFILASYKLNGNNMNFLVINYYNRVTSMSPYPENNFVWEIFHSMAARYRPLLYFIYTTTHIFLVAPCYTFFATITDSIKKYPEMCKIINPYSVQFCYLTFIYWNFNPSPEPFEWI